MSVYTSSVVSSDAVRGEASLSSRGFLLLWPDLDLDLDLEEDEGLRPDLDLDLEDLDFLGAGASSSSPSSPLSAAGVGFLDVHTLDWASGFFFSIGCCFFSRSPSNESSSRWVSRLFSEGGDDTEEAAFWSSVLSSESSEGSAFTGALDLGTASALGSGCLCVRLSRSPSSESSSACVPERATVGCCRGATAEADAGFCFGLSKSPSRESSSACAPERAAGTCVAGGVLLSAARAVGFSISPNNESSSACVLERGGADRGPTPCTKEFNSFREAT
mmetsp:Transcript_35022/g.88125  ORF Transcript_35022/g.88125 Transcript_35022/m.88125 type:complete len:275 (+) Transcript_35022:1234-2058(+)